MAKTLTLNTEIPPNRELRITPPADVSTSSAEIIITVSPSGSSTAMICRDLLDSEFFGVWRDRADIGGSMDFARKLRSEGWNQPV